MRLFPNFFVLISFLLAFSKASYATFADEVDISQKGYVNFQVLPDELLTHVFSFLPDQELVMVSGDGRWWQAVANEAAKQKIIANSNQRWLRRAVSQEFNQWKLLLAQDLNIKFVLNKSICELTVASDESKLPLTKDAQNTFIGELELLQSAKGVKHPLIPLAIVLTKARLSERPDQELKEIFNTASSTALDDTLGVNHEIMALLYGLEILPQKVTSAFFGRLKETLFSWVRTPQERFELQPDFDKALSFATVAMSKGRPFALHALLDMQIDVNQLFELKPESANFTLSEVTGDEERSKEFVKHSNYIEKTSNFEEKIEKARKISIELAKHKTFEPLLHILSYTYVYAGALCLNSSMTDAGLRSYKQCEIFEAYLQEVGDATPPFLYKYLYTMYNQVLKTFPDLKTPERTLKQAKLLVSLHKVKPAEH